MAKKASKNKASGATHTYITNNILFQEFLTLLGKMTHGNLIRQIEYLKVENQILRGKLGSRVSTTSSEKRRLIEFGLPLGGDIRNIISIVGYSTFRRWVSKGISSGKQPKRGEDTWDAFLKRHFETLWACDFFTKTVWTTVGPKIFHVLFFINIRARKVHIAGITRYPKKEWVINQVKTISFFIPGR